MLADFYVPKLSNGMKIAVQKNNLVGQIWYRSLDPVKKNGGRTVFKMCSLPKSDSGHKLFDKSPITLFG